MTHATHTTPTHVIVTRTEDIRDDATLATIHAANGLTTVTDDTEVGTASLPVSEDTRTWNDAADVEIADAGYRRVGDWQTSGDRTWAPLVRGWQISTSNADQPVLNLDDERWQALLVLNPQERTAHVTSRLRGDSSHPAAEWHGVLRTLTVPSALTPAELVTALWGDTTRALLDRVAAGHTVERDAHGNLVGLLTDDADRALDDLHEWAAELEGAHAVWLAADWFADLPPTLTGSETDDDLTTLAETLDTEALSETVVLAGTRGYLERRRQEVLDAADEEDEEG